MKREPAASIGKARRSTGGATRRCAIYTRKSHEDGLEQDFNSLHAQRDNCETYIAGRREEGWVLIPERYDDGGFSGATLDRPAMKRLLADVKAGRIDVVVAYRADRLSRSPRDFEDVSDILDAHGATFVSATEALDSSTPSGRLQRHMMLGFANYEREVITERIRDKVAASRKKGIWMGGWAPLGYRVRIRKLVIREEEAKVVREVFERFAKGGSVADIARDLQKRGFRNQYGKSLDKGRIYKLLNNRVYVGEAVHKGTAYPGQHKAIITRSLWNRVQAILAEAPRMRAGKARAQTPALLKGLIFDAQGRAMSPSHTRRGQRLYRYYVSQSVIRGIASPAADATTGDVNPQAANLIHRVPAGEVEAAVIAQLRKLLCSPEIIVATWRAARKELPDLAESDVRDAIHRFDPLWDELFPAEQARIVHLLVQRVTVTAAGLGIRLRVEGLSAFAGELTAGTAEEAGA